MVRKYFIEQVLAKCKGFAKVFVGLCILASFSACDQEMSEPVPQVAKVVDSLQVAPATRSSARSFETTSPGWSEGSYDVFIASKYTIPTPVRIQSDYYKFRVIPSDGNTIEVWIKYFSPQGNIVYQQMERRGSSFEIQRIFQQEGKYSYAFFVKRFGSVGYPRISQQGLSVNVKLPVRIPSVGDDYKQYLKVSYSGGEPHDQWYFGTYQCTSWVALKINQMWGTKTTFWNKMFGQRDRLGDAKNWKRILVNHGYVADQIPKAGDVIWFPEHVKEWSPKEKRDIVYSKGDGHVGFVHKVEGVTITYSNYDGGNPTSYRVSTLTNDFVQRHGIYFIHVQRKVN